MTKQKKKEKQSILKALNDKEPKDIANFFTLNKSKESDFDFNVCLKSLDDDDFTPLWDNIFEVVKKVAPSLFVREEETASEETFPTIICSHVIQVATNLANITLAAISFVPIGLLQTAVFLHDIFLRFSAEEDAVKNSISALCEKFWYKDFHNKEELMLNASYYVLSRSLRPKAKKSDVARVWCMKDAIQILMTNETDRDDLLPLCKLCVSSPVYLSTPEGCKFIQFLLCVDVTLVENIHDIIKLYLPSCSMQQSESYGNIYYNSWAYAVKEDLQELKQKLELSCIQDLMYHALHVPRTGPKTVVNQLRKILQVFNKKKKDVRTLRMMRDLYEPILWRALRDANGNVRANTSQIFVDAFPLEDPDFNIADMETELLRQFIIIKELLSDEHPAIRCIAISGVSTILSINWELCPSEMVKTYLNIMVNELACDSSSVEVRLAVIAALHSILQKNKLALPTLKVFLPKFVDLFHDISEKVRVNFCKLLLVVKKIRFIHYWEVVPLNHLLARLVEDVPIVEKLIVELVANSYLPVQKSTDLWFGRLVELIKGDRMAVRPFFQHLPDFVDIPTLVKYMTVLCKALVAYVKSKAKVQANEKRKSKTSLANKENETVNKLGGSTFKKHGGDIIDSVILKCVFDSITILWVGLQNKFLDPAIPENKKHFKRMLAVFSKFVPDLLTFFKDTELCSEVALLGGFIPPIFAPNISNIVTTQLKNPESDLHCESLITCLCLQGRSRVVFSLISKYMKMDLDEHAGQPPKKKRKSNQASVVEEEDHEKVSLRGVKFLEVLLNHSLCRNKMIELDDKDFQEIFSFMDPIKELVKNRKTTLDSVKEKNLISQYFSCITTLAVFAQANFKDKNTPQVDSFLQELLTWTSCTFFSNSTVGETPPIRRRSRASTSVVIDTPTDMWKDLGFLIVKALLKFCHDAQTVGLEDALHYVNFAKDAISSEYGPKLVGKVIDLLSPIYNESKFHVDKQDRQDWYKNLVISFFTFILKAFENDDFFSKVDESDKQYAKTQLKELLHYHAKHDYIPKDCLQSLVNQVFESLYIKSQSLMDDVDVDQEYFVNNFPSASSLFLSFVMGNNLVVKLFVNTVISWRMHKSLSDSLYALVIIFHMVRETKGQIKQESEIKEFIKAFEESFGALDVEAASEEERCMLTHGNYLILSIRQSLEKE